MGLRSKLAIVFLALLGVMVVAISAIQIDRTMNLMVTDLTASGDLLSDQLYEQIRVILAVPRADPIGAVRTNAALRSMIDSYRAFSRNVAYVAIENPDQVAIITSPIGLKTRSSASTQSLGTLRKGVSSWLGIARIFLLWGNTTYEMRREIRLNGKPFVEIRVGLSTALSAAELRHSIRQIVIFAALAMALGISCAMFVGGVLLRPVAELASGVDELAAGRNTQVRIGARDELGTLAEKFNQLSQRLNHDRSQWEQERGQFFSIFRSITDAVLLLDANGAILFANAEATGKLGLPAGGITDGKPLRLLLGRHHPLTRMIDAVYATGAEVHDVAVEIGERRPMRLLVSIFSLGRGREPAGLLAIVRDLEPVRQLESVVDQSGRLARMGALVTGIAHQVRNPLNAMNLQLELLTQDAELGRPVTPRLEAVRKEMKRLDEAVYALTRFIRPESLQLQHIELNALIEDIGMRVTHPGITVQYEFDTRATSIDGDRALLSEAIRNVANNAVEAMPEGGSVRFQTRATAEGFIEIKIADHGQGIPSEHLDHIFQLYFTTKSTGTGVGLSLATRAIDLHRGTLHVESELGSGTTVTIRLPTGDRRIVSNVGDAA